MFGSELDQVFVFVVVVRVERYLLKIGWRVSSLWGEVTYLVHSGYDCCDFQDLPEMVNGEIADADAPVKAGALDTEEVHREGLGYVVSPSF